MGKNDSADFEKKYPVYRNEQESAEAQNKSFMELPFEFI